MIISRTPYRVSFFGGGTDYPAWYRENGGAVLAAAIARYCYLPCRWLPPFFEHKSRIVYSIIEDVQRVEEIRHPAVRECLLHLGIRDGIEIHHDGDLPKMTGLGTSSSFTVGLLHSLHALRGEFRSKMQLAEEAIHVERDRCGDRVGSQDQVSAAFGGLNHIQFAPDDSISVEPVPLTSERMTEFQDSLLLFFTGFSRYSSEVVAEQLQNVPKKGKELSEMAAMVDEGLRILTGGRDLADFGRLLHDGWMLKRSLSSRVSTPEIDAMYETARKAGALGGKLAGAGGGGFLLLYVEPERQPAVRKALSHLLHVPFDLDHSGSQIIFSNPTSPEPAP
ncbi:MAG TPA: kinase [Verrucomicrobia bacterium]|nr:kinase [Verrucomicrobiota bacterium]